MTETKKNTTETPTDYQKLYEKECAKNKALELKIAEFEKICNSFSEREHKASEMLKRATLEYNARTQYMLDCAKHAYISMQFAVAAAEDKKGGNK